MKREGLRSLFHGPSVPRAFATADSLAQALRRQLTGADAASDRAETLRGQIAGLNARDRATLPTDPATGSPRYRGGFLAGHLHAHQIRALGTTSVELLLPTAAYAASLLNPQAERNLAEPPPKNLTRTHAYACLRVTERMELAEDLELVACRWLADQLAIPWTSALESDIFETRGRRLELVAEREMDQRGDTAAAAAHRVARRLAQHAADLERQLASSDAASIEADRLRGALAGLAGARSGLGDADRPPGGPDGDASEAYRGGFLGAHLLATLVRDGRRPDDELRLTCYRVGAVLASAQAWALLREPPPKNVLKAHRLAVHLVNARTAEAVAEDLEVAILGWLAAQLDLPMSPDLLEARRRFIVQPRRRE